MNTLTKLTVVIVVLLSPMAANADPIPVDSAPPQPNDVGAPLFEYVDLGQAVCCGALNDLGQVTAIFGSATTMAGIWDPIDGIIEIGALPGGNSVNPVAINNNLQVAGTGSTFDPSPIGDTRDQGWIWDDAEGIRGIGTLPGDRTTIAKDMNEHGVIVGESRDPTGQPRQAFIWDEINGMLSLGTLSGFRSSVATGINNNNEVVGNVQSESAERSVFYWSEETGITDLRATIGISTIEEVQSINDQGEIIGTYADEAGTRRGFVWSETRGFVDLGILPNRMSTVPTAINEHSQIVGHTGRGTGTWMWDNGQLYDLIDLLPGLDPRVSLRNAIGINEASQILGSSWVDIGGTRELHAFLITPVPVPEPGTLALFSIGLLGLTLARKK